MSPRGITSVRVAYTNTHVRVDGGDELLVKEILFRREEDEAENEDGESTGKKEGTTVDSAC